MGKDGIKAIDTYKIGKIVMELGGGRNTKEDKIDFDAGIVINFKIGQYVAKNDVIFEIYSKKR